MEAEPENSPKLMEIESSVVDDQNATAADINSVDDSNATAADINAADDSNATAADINAADDSNATAADINAADDSNVITSGNEKKKNLRKTSAEDEKHLAEIKEKRTQELEALLSKSEFFASFFESVEDDIIIESHKKSKSAQADAKTEKKRKRSHSAMRRGTGPGEPSEQDENANNSPTKKTALGFVVSKDQPSLLDGAVMRDYQIEGLKWMRKLYVSGMNGILADEMGLGKTIQVISLICLLYEQQVNGPYLVLGPLSTLPNWVSEFETFASRIPVVFYHGNIKERMALRNEISNKHELKEDGKKERIVFPVVVTSFEIVMSDIGYLNKLNWKYIFVDEGHRLKNPNSLIKEVMSSVSSVNRMILSGTPIQNSLEELWSLLNFLLPTCFNSLQAFESWLSVDELITMTSSGSESFLRQEREDKIIKKMHQILQPFILRRVKADVNLKLPGKKEVIIDCPLTQYQLDWYRYVLDLQKNLHDEKVEQPDCSSRKLRSQLKKQPTSRAPPALMGHFRDISCPGRKNCYEDVRDGQEYIINLKMCGPLHILHHIVNHPFMVTIPVLPGGNKLEVDPEEIISKSGKMFILDSLLKRLKPRGHKVVLFSTSTFFLEIIEKYLINEGFKYHLLTGNTKVQERKESIKEFNTNPESFIYLISTRAGGLGINLCAADTVIIVNSDWNPQVDLQAQDRCHRIGQTKPVIVYRLRVSGTVDEAIFHRALAKRKLEKIIIQKGNFGKKEQGPLDLDELKMILEEKITSNEMVIGNKDFSDEEWEKLLDRSDIPTIDDLKEARDA